MADANLEKCIKALKSAQSDSDKFAALILVTKIVKSENSDASARKEIINALGYKFLTRLLKTTTVPDDCPQSIYKSVALSILSSCCSDPEVASHPELKKQVTVFSEIIIDGINNSEDESEQNILTDCYDCLNGMASTKTGQETLIEGGIVPSLVMVITSNSKEHEKAFNLLMRLLQSCGLHTWNGNTSCYDKIMNWLVADFKQHQDARKFELCEILVFFLSNFIADDTQKRSWICPLVSTLNEVLRCKLGAAQREPALKLASFVVTVCGVENLLPPVTEDNKLVLLITHLSCIEVRMLLEDGNAQEIECKIDVLCAYYALLEAVIGYMTIGQSLQLDQKQVIQLHSAMVGAFNSVIFFLSEEAALQSQHDSHRPIVIVSVRILGAWLAEETSSLKKEIFNLLPFLVHICKVSVKKNNNVCQTLEAMTLKEKSESELHTESCEKSEHCVDQITSDAKLVAQQDKPYCKSGEAFSTVDVLRFLLPGFCHLTSEDEARQILLDEGLHSLLVDYFKQKMEVLLANKEDSEIQDTVCTLCGIFLNLTVTEPSLSGSHHQFHRLMDCLFLYLPQVVFDSNLLLVTSNFASLGLMILRSQVKRKDVIIEHRDEFLAACISFLKKAHCMSQTSHQPSLVLSQAYSNLWSSIKLLWFISLDSLIVLISSLPEVIQIVMKSGWLVSLAKTLVDVNAAGVNNDLRGTFIPFLVAAASNSSAARKVLCEKGGLDVARIYNSPELSSVLSSC